MIKLVKLTFINKTTEFAIVYDDFNLEGSMCFYLWHNEFENEIHMLDFALPEEIEILIEIS